MVLISCITGKFHLQTIEYNNLSIIEDKNNYGLDLEGFFLLCFEFLFQKPTQILIEDELK